MFNTINKRVCVLGLIGAFVVALSVFVGISISSSNKAVATPNSGVVAATPRVASITTEPATANGHALSGAQAVQFAQKYGGEGNPAAGVAATTAKLMTYAQAVVLMADGGGSSKISPNTQVWVVTVHQPYKGMMMVPPGSKPITSHGYSVIMEAANGQITDMWTLT